MSDDRSQPLLKNRTFWKRTISGFVMSCVLVAVFITGYDIMLICMGLLSLLGMYELNRALRNGWGAISLTSYAAIIVHYVLLKFVESKYIILVYGVAIIVMMLAFVLTYPKYELAQIFGAYFGIFYIGVNLSLLYLLRIHPPSGAYLVWLAVFCSWGSDICAYLVGMKLGKHQLVPNLSPKKSIEGAIGGLVGAAALAAIYGLVVQKYIPDVKLAPLAFAGFCLIGAAAGQIGDLGASAIKRKLGIKDFGKILPGHGGILDRFDSMMFVAPITYLVTIYAIMV